MASSISRLRAFMALGRVRVIQPTWPLMSKETDSLISNPRSHAIDVSVWIENYATPESAIPPPCGRGERRFVCCRIGVTSRQHAKGGEVNNADKCHQRRRSTGRHQVRAAAPERPAHSPCTPAEPLARIATLQ